MAVEWFTGNDRGYLDWIADHQDGFVVNMRRPKPDPGYLVLHRATCRMISSSNVLAGAWTERAYQKICSRDLSELQNKVREFGRKDGSFSKACRLCHPLGAP